MPYVLTGPGKQAPQHPLLAFVGRAPRHDLSGLGRAATDQKIAVRKQDKVLHPPMKQISHLRNSVAVYSAGPSARAHSPSNRVDTVAAKISVADDGLAGA